MSLHGSQPAYVADGTEHAVTEPEVLQAIRSQKHGKAADASGAFAELIGTGPQSLRFWTRTINELIKVPDPSTVLDEAAYTSLIIPILKLGSDDRIANIRPITVAPLLTRIVSSLLHRRLLAEIGHSHTLRRRTEDTRIAWSGISVEQAGFKLRRSADNQAQALVECIRTYWHRNRALRGPQLRGSRSVFCAFLDWRRAFDSVYVDPAEPLSALNRLRGMKVSATTLRLLSFIEHTRLTRVQIGKARSRAFSLPRGVAQGLQSSPTLFTWYTDYWTTALQSLRRPDGTFISGIPIGEFTLQMLAFADDIAIVAESMEDLQLLVSALVALARLDGFTIQAKKCAWIEFRPPSEHGPLTSGLHLHIDNEEIPQVSSFRYLGVILDEHLTMQKHVERRSQLVRHELHCVLTHTLPHYSRHQSPSWRSWILSTPM